MNQSEQGQPSFFETLPPNATEEQFRDAISQVMSQEEYDVLGDEAAEIITESFAFLGAFAPEPATFDTTAFEVVTVLDPDIARHVLQFGVKMGLINKKGDRYSVDEDVLGLFHSFLS